MARRKRPQVRVTLSVFDTRDPLYRPVRTAVPLDEFEPITGDDYKPAGGTPLRDAVGRFIGHLSQLRQDDVVTVGLLLDESSSIYSTIGRESVIEQANQFVHGLREVDKVDPDAAGTVMCVIITDGEENSSREIEPQALKRLIKDSEGDGFTMIFMGAGVDAWHEGANLGFRGASTSQVVSYGSTPASQKAAMASVTNDAQSYLSCNTAYHDSRVASSMRSITDDGEELLTNTNAGS